MSGLTREQQADLALWDYGSRTGATAKKVEKQMKDAGFTKPEILAAVNRMHVDE